MKVLNCAERSVYVEFEDWRKSNGNNRLTGAKTRLIVELWFSSDFCNEYGEAIVWDVGLEIELGCCPFATCSRGRRMSSVPVI